MTYSSLKIWAMPPVLWFFALAPFNASAAGPRGLPPHISIVNFDTSFEQTLFELHRQAFEPVEGAKDYFRAEARFKKQLAALPTLVAVDGSRPVGFDVAGRVGDHPPLGNGSSYADFFTDMLGWGRGGEAKADALRIHLEARSRETGGKVMLRFYDNVFVRNKKQALATDYAHAVQVVHPDYQRLGIGSALLRQQIGASRKAEAEAFFATCWGRASARLHRAHRFQPIILTGPGYNDGTPAKYVGRFIRRR